MLSREDLKSRAKLVLRKTYWHPLVTSIIIAFVGDNNNWSRVALTLEIKGTILI